MYTHCTNTVDISSAQTLCRAVMCKQVPRLFHRLKMNGAGAQRIAFLQASESLAIRTRMHCMHTYKGKTYKTVGAQRKRRTTHRQTSMDEHGYAKSNISDVLCVVVVCVIGIHVFSAGNSKSMLHEIDGIMRADERRVMHAQKWLPHLERGRAAHTISTPHRPAPAHCPPLPRLV